MNRQLARARALYVELATQPERERLQVFDMRTTKWSETRVKSRKQLVSALKRAESDTGEIFDREIARV